MQIIREIKSVTDEDQASPPQPPSQPRLVQNQRSMETQPSSATQRQPSSRLRRSFQFSESQILDVTETAENLFTQVPPLVDFYYHLWWIFITIWFPI